jgi:hypothetical protein
VLTVCCAPDRPEHVTIFVFYLFSDDEMVGRLGAGPVPGEHEPAVCHVRAMHCTTRSIPPVGSSWSSAMPECLRSNAASTYKRPIASATAYVQSRMYGRSELASVSVRGAPGKQHFLPPVHALIEDLRKN